jgi:hypothetical protein
MRLFDDLTLPGRCEMKAVMISININKFVDQKIPQLANQGGGPGPAGEGQCLKAVTFATEDYPVPITC